MMFKFISILIIGVLLSPAMLVAAGGHGGEDGHFLKLPVSLDEYKAKEAELGIEGLWERVLFRAGEDPFNVAVTVIFLLAVAHTFASGWFREKAHHIEVAHRKQRAEARAAAGKPEPKNPKEDTSFSATVMHFLGEVEAIFGIWCVPLVACIVGFHGWHSVTNYIDYSVKYTEPMFVVVIMAIASTRPILQFSEQALGAVAKLGGGTPKAWWFSILTIAPLLGSFITEPAAMTIAALLLGKLIYQLDPSPKFKYATLGLLFVNISVGGTMTHFAAPPVLMVAGTWGWDMQFMFIHFGWKAVVGILISTAIYSFFLRNEFKALEDKGKELYSSSSSEPEEPIPFWITFGVLVFMIWTVVNLHHPPLFIGGFLFFLAFVQATATHQDDVSIKNPLLVGFFLAGLVTHGTLQQWWISPVLGSLGEFSLFLGATVLTAFNDNAAITFLASQVPEFAPSMGQVAIDKEYAVVAGAVTGGGLTVIANAPNPAGQSILQKYFPSGIAPQWLFVGALVPTVILGSVFMVIH